MTRPTTLVVAALTLLPAVAHAQTLGTFRWQFQPYCNVATVTVTQVGGVYRVEGTDDQCGGGRDLASVQGLAFPNPDGSIGFGMSIVTAPGGAPVHVDADMSVATASGTWRDSAGATGTFAFTPGAGSGGTPRPQPSASIPSTIRLLTDGGLVAGGAPDVGTIPAIGAGTRMMWYPGKASFRAGYVDGVQWNDANVGPYSVAMGLNTTASGHRSTAFGEVTSATGSGSTAMGVGTAANGAYSTAMGLSTAANGLASIAVGQQSVAGGTAAAALGFATTASANYATAIGQGTTAAGQASFAGGRTSSATGVEAFAFGVEAVAGGVGSFALGRTARTTASAPGSLMFADRSTTAPFVSNAANEVGVRAAGGVYLYTRADLGTGVALAANGSSWAALSDVNAKENFREVGGEHLLAKLARIPIREWNYKAQDETIRHLGPTAQDFRAAFGLGDFPLRINTIDADGVALAGVQALEARTRALPQQAADLAALRAENAVLKAELAAQRKQLHRLEQLLQRK